MQATVTIDERRVQLEQLWLDNRYAFLAEYSRVVGRPANDPTMSLRAIIDRIIDRETTTSRDGR
jgi:hypothetical protein